MTDGMPKLIAAMQERTINEAKDSIRRTYFTSATTTHPDLDWVDEILAGIDRTEDTTDHAMMADGWWPTSTGARFGAERLAALKSEIIRRYHA